MSNYNVFVSEPKFRNGDIFSLNVEWVVVDKILFRFAICRSVPEIFAIKDESCQKSRRILDVFFVLPNFRGGGAAFQKFPFYHPTSRLGTSPGKSFMRILDPNTSEVLFAHTLNFKQNFKFSRLKFFWGPPSLGVS